MKIGKFIIMISVLGIIVCIWVKIGSKHSRENNLLLTNHVKFSGKVISYNRSTNHAFGIIRIKVTESNTKALTDSVSKGLFPYKIKNSFAEFYGYVPASLKVGQKILLESDKRVIEVYDNNVIIWKADVSVSTEENDIAYVNKNTMFK